MVKLNIIAPGASAPPSHLDGPEFEQFTSSFLSILSAIPKLGRDELLVEATKRITIDGPIMEFGVASGYSVNVLADALPDKTVYGFDSFKGLPENWMGRNHLFMYKGSFACDVPEVRDNVILVEGLFSDTLPAFLEEHKEPAALIHIDCDIYSSTVTIFEQLENRIVDGTVVVFDELCGYNGWEVNEFLALFEFLHRTGKRCNIIASHENAQHVLCIFSGE